MKTIETLDQLKSWQEYRDYMKESLKLVSGESTCYVSKDKLDFDLGGKPWKGHAILAGEKAVISVRKLKKEGVIFREGVCTRKAKDLYIGGLQPEKLLKEAEKTFLKLRLGYQVHAAVAGGTAPDATSDESTVTIGEGTVVKQVPLGALRWGGRLHGKLWAMTDTHGAVVKSGSGPRKGMASMNNLGARALRAIDELEKLDARWRSQFDATRKASTQAESDLKKLQKALPALKKRMKKDGDFFGDVDGYLVALEKAESIVGRIRKAEKEFDKASHELRAAVFAHDVDEAKKKVAGAEDELKALEADIEEAKQIFGSVMETVIQVAKQDWEGLATRAVAALGESSIEASYAPQLKQLRQQLATAKGDLTRLKSKELVSRIEAARAGVEAAAIGYENAQGELKTALDQLARKRKNAENELEESSSTAIAGKLIAQRATQLNVVAQARAVCRRYVHDSKAVAKSIQQISLEYGRVGTWLDGAAQADPAFRRDTPYAKTLELSARSNGVKLNEWTAWADAVGDKCGKALGWLLDEGPKGPMGPFERGTQLVKQGLGGAS